MEQGFGALVDQAWQQFQAHTVLVVPRLMVGGLVLLLGAVIAFIVGWAARWALRTMHLDRQAARLGLSSSLESIGVSSSVHAVARLLQGGIVFASTILALYALDPRLASDLAERVLLYLPQLLAGAIILAAGSLVSRFAGRSVLIAAVNAELPSARLLSSLARGAVLLTSWGIALEQVGIGRYTVLIAFSILLGGVTLAGAIAVGLGAQEVVRRWVDSRAAPTPPPVERETMHHW